MAISTYLIKKGSFEFEQILSEGYTFDTQPVILNQSTKADGSIKTVYAQYSNITVTLKFGNLDGATILSYASQLIDGEYEVWNPYTGEYESYEFVVTKNPVAMISMLNGERYTDYEVILTKAEEVTVWSV